MIALDGASGKQLWQFNSRIVGRQPSRGLTYWSDGKESKLFAYIMNFLYALDPVTGQPIGAFGENGRLDMRKDLDSDYTQNSVALTTPGVLCGDLLVRDVYRHDLSILLQLAQDPLVGITAAELLHQILAILLGRTE